MSYFRSDLPVGIDAVLSRAIAKNRRDRYSSAKAFRAALTAEWALFRTAGVARGRPLRKHRPEAPTLPAVEEASGEEMTEVNVHVEFDPGD